MDSKAVVSWLGVIARTTSSVSITGTSAAGSAGQVLAPVPLIGVSASGSAGMLISKARVTWVGITPRNVREVSINGVSTTVVQGELTTPVPIHGVSSAANAGYLVSKARLSWINISASPDKSVGLTQVSSQVVGGDVALPSDVALPRMRVVYLNVADSASIQASSEYAAYPVANVQNDRKVISHRSTSLRLTYTLTWASDQQVGAVALPATNLTSGATIRVRLFSDEACTELLGDSGTLLACPAAHLGLYGLSQPLDVSSFAYAGATKAAVWFKRQRTTVRGCTVYIEDLQNPAGFIDCSRLVVGPYWEAPKNPDYGAQVAYNDLTRTQRSDCGDLWATRGAMHESMSLTLSDIPERSRATLGKIIRSSASSRNMFFSLFPTNETATAEQVGMIYGRRASSPFTLDMWDSNSTKIDIDGW